MLKGSSKPSRRGPESGQTMLFVTLGLGLFLIGAMTFALDLSNLWFRRQAAQTAADAACTAGAMDLLQDANQGATQKGHFGSTTSAAVPFDCFNTTPNTSTTNPSPCYYAQLNGYNSSLASGSSSIGNNVYVDFPTGVTGVSTPPANVAPTAFMRVTVTENLPTFFAGMLRGITKQNIRAYAVCGVALEASPIPILVLDTTSPNTNPATSALFDKGSATIQIFGGPQQSIQVNSLVASGSCGKANCSVNVPFGSATIDLSQAGPSGNGADMGVSGAPAAPVAGINFIPGSAGHWLIHTPLADPFQLVCAPDQDITTCNSTVSWGGNTYTRPAVPSETPTIPTDISNLGGQCATFQSITNNKGKVTTANLQGGGCHVGYQVHGCPDHSGCTYFMAGPYDNGITISSAVAVFDPGLYYITNGLALNDNSVVRTGTGTGDSSGGVTFYFSGTGTVTVTSNAGKNPGSDIVDSFNSMKGPVDGTGTQYPTPNALTRGAQCDVNSSVPANLNNGGAGINIDGNILLGPCIGYYGDPLGTTEPNAGNIPPGPGEQRGFLFFQDHAAQSTAPSWGGGGQFLLAGTMYFHSCNASGTGTSCGAPTTWLSDVFSLGGNSGSTTYVLGEVVTDNLVLQGGSTLAMDLNPTSANNILKASLYQ